MMNKDTLRISASLAGFAIFVLFVAYWLGYIPDESKLRAQSRVIVSESLAIQFSVTAQQENMASIPLTIKTIVERNADIKAIVLRSSAGEIIASHGQVVESGSTESTINYMVVPIFKDSTEWARLEISFNAFTDRPWWKFIDSTFYQLVVFSGILVFAFYYLLIRKLFRYLDPNKVIPERVKKALNALSEGVVIIDANGDIVLTNYAFDKKMNQRSQQLIGRKLSELAWLYPENASGCKQVLPWDEALVNGRSSNQIKLNFSHSDDLTSTVLCNSTPLYDSRQSIRGVMVSLNDVSELEKMNQDLESMAQFLRHEMNNALVGATSTISLIESSAHLSDSDKKLLGRAHQSHRVIRYLLDSVGHANSIEASFSQEHTYPLRLDIIISETVAKYNGIYASNKFTYQSNNEAVIVLGEEERIVQMLDKLATNAIDHGGEGTSVGFSCHKSAGNAIITVTNTGAALPENKQAVFDLFASFNQGGVTNQHQGIGLYVVKLIAETYGGKVYACDRVDVPGAEFVIELPLAE